MPSGQIRRPGGGRKDIVKTQQTVEEIFLEVIEGHVAGDPMNKDIRWLKLTRAEISEKMRAYRVEISRNIVRKLMKKHKFVKRKLQRKRSTGTSVFREQQFKNILSVKEEFMKSANPIISVDTKKKEPIGGNLHRNGSVYCTQAVEVSDHDYEHLSECKIAPHGIYDVKQNKAHITIGTSAETAEFICDSLEKWWLTKGKKSYPKAKEILMFCDAGGANCYRHRVFKAEVQLLVNKIKIPLKIMHYPPYASKWNPIEHRVFPHVTRALEGAPLNTVKEAKDRIICAKTKTGLKVTANIIQKTYETGKVVAKNFMENMKITFGESVPLLNYTISPMGKCEM